MTDANDRATLMRVLSTPLDPKANDAGAETVLGYLTQLLVQVWDENEGFSGKRPFGTSGWTWDLAKPLSEAGFVEATFDEDGYLEDLKDPDLYDALIHNAILALAHVSLSPDMRPEES